MKKRALQFALLLLLAQTPLLSQTALADVRNVQGQRTVKVRGEGPDAKSALRDAEIAAIQMSISRLVHSEAELQKWNAIQADFLAQRKRFLKRLRIVGKGTTANQGRFYTIRFRVQEAQLREALVEAGVIQSSAELSAAANYPKIAAYYVDPRDNSPYALWSVERINSYLLNQKFRVVDPKLWAKLAKEDDILAQSQGSSSRLGQIMALRSSADIYLEVAIQPKVVGRSGDYTYVQTPVVLKAYESSSGEPFITKVYQRLNAQNEPEALAIKGNVDVSAKIVVEEAVGGVMPEVFADLSRYWKANLVQGKQYRLVFQGANAEQLETCQATLRGRVKDIKVLPNNTLLIRTSGDLSELADQLEEELGDSLGMRLHAFDLGNVYFVFAS